MNKTWETLLRRQIRPDEDMGAGLMPNKKVNTGYMNFENPLIQAMREMGTKSPKSSQAAKSLLNNSLSVGPKPMKFPKVAKKLGGLK